MRLGPLSALPLIVLCSLSQGAESGETKLQLNAQGYLEAPGINVMLGNDFYPEGHQGGVSIIQNGRRVATNGDLRLDRTPGQWQPVPKVGEQQVDSEKQTLRVHSRYPDPEKNGKGFNPITYPDLDFGYAVSVTPEGQGFRIRVDLDAPLPKAWEGRVAFNLELFPGLLFGKAWMLDENQGAFPRQANGPGRLNDKGEIEIQAMAKGRRLVVAPEDDSLRLTIEAVKGGDLELIDGRGEHDNGWFVVRAATSPGVASSTLEWRVIPHGIPGFIAPPTIQVSQVGYHPAQEKFALVEVDPADTRRPPLVLERVRPDGSRAEVLRGTGKEWGRFLRSLYLKLDFSAVKEPGTYVVRHGSLESHAFRIGTEVFSRGVWQPTLEYFLPIQMCHMRINDRYRVWHGVCHLDDARMAPTGFNHFDGYLQGPSTFCHFSPGDHVPGLTRGGWHDAGDDDLRIESQAETIRGLALAYEEFGVEYDYTTIDQEKRLVEIHRPDGQPDMLQQIEHGLLTVLGGYRSLGRLYRGIITPTLRQYVLLGDPSNVTDNRIETGPSGTETDDRLVFTEQNARHELQTCAALAAAARVLKAKNPALASECLTVARELWDRAQPPTPGFRLIAAVELLLTTGEGKYAEFLNGQGETIRQGFAFFAWESARALKAVDRPEFTQAVTKAARAYAAQIEALSSKTPYEVPYEPSIWGGGWSIQRFGVQQYHLHKTFPALFKRDLPLKALGFILGVHPGSNTSSFVSGVGARSATTAYGFNRADWGYIPGGSISGTALIRPDFPELLEWPFLWQQTEYVLGGGTTDYLFLALAAAALETRE